MDFPQNFRLRTRNQYAPKPSPEVAPSKMEVAPSQMEVAPFQMEVAPFFVDFHHFLSIFTIFYRFSRFTHFCRDLHFVAIYALFPQFFFGQNSLLRNITRFLHVCLNMGSKYLICQLFVSFSFHIFTSKVLSIMRAFVSDLFWIFLNFLLRFSKCSRAHCAVEI